MTTVYIDVLFLVNLIVDLMIYLSSCVLRRKRAVWWRLLCASCVGAVWSCTVFFCFVPPLISNGISILLYALCAMLVLGYGGIRQYIMNIAATMLSAFIFAGVFVLIYRFFDFGSIVTFNNNVLYIDIPVFVLLCVSFLCFGAVALASRCFTRVVDAAGQYTARVFLCGRCVLSRAKTDTGNTLVDSVTGFPAALCTIDFARRILPKGGRLFVEASDASALEPELVGRMRMLPCATATGVGLLPAFRPDALELTRGKVKLKVDKVLICVSDCNLDGADILLPPQIFGKDNDDDGFI